MLWEDAGWESPEGGHGDSPKGNLEGSSRSPGDTRLTDTPAPPGGGEEFALLTSPGALLSPW